MKKLFSRIYVLALVITVNIICFDRIQAQELTISGTISINQSPLSGATIYISGSNRKFKSKINGNYTVTVPNGAGTYTITVIPRSSAVAVPINKMVSINSSKITDFNFDLTKAIAGQSIIYGRVVSGRQALEGVKVRLAGIGDTVTDKNGIYIFDKLTAGRYYLTTTLSSYTFSANPKKILLRSDRILRLNITGRPAASGSTYATNFAGLYTLTAGSQNTTCKFQKDSISGPVLISQFADRIRVKLPTLGSISGKVQEDGFSIEVNKFKNFCRFKGTVGANFSQIDTQSNKATIQGNAVISCFGQTDCNLSFVGELSRR